MATHALARRLLLAPRPASPSLSAVLRGSEVLPGLTAPAELGQSCHGSLDPDASLTITLSGGGGAIGGGNIAGSREGDKIVGELSTSQASKPAASLSEMTGYC